MDDLLPKAACGIRIADPIEMIPQKIMTSGRAGGMKNSEPLKAD